jgi:hypothetical protein
MASLHCFRHAIGSQQRFAINLEEFDKKSIEEVAHNQVSFSMIVLTITSQFVSASHLLHLFLPGS